MSRKLRSYAPLEVDEGDESGHSDAESLYEPKSGNKSKKKSTATNIIQRITGTGATNGKHELVQQRDDGQEGEEDLVQELERQQQIEREEEEKELENEMEIIQEDEREEGQMQSTSPSRTKDFKSPSSRAHQVETDADGVELQPLPSKSRLSPSPSPVPPSSAKKYQQQAADSPARSAKGAISESNLAPPTPSYVVVPVAKDKSEQQQKQQAQQYKESIRHHGPALADDHYPTSYQPRPQPKWLRTFTRLRWHYLLPLYSSPRLFPDFLLSRTSSSPSFLRL